MIHKPNAPGRNQIHHFKKVDQVPRATESDDIDRRSSEGAGGGGLHSSAHAKKKSIDIVFDLEDHVQAESLEQHNATFGDDYFEVEPLGNGKVVLKLYPGGARRLL